MGTSRGSLRWGGDHIWVASINNRGQVVGHSSTQSGEWHAAMWTVHTVR